MIGSPHLSERQRDCRRTLSARPAAPDGAPSVPRDCLGSRSSRRTVGQKIRIAGDGAEERADDRPGNGVDFHADLVRGQFVERHLARIRCSAERSFRGENQVLRPAWWSYRSAVRKAVFTMKSITWPVVSGIGRDVGKTAERCVGRGVDHADPGAVRHAAEIDDHVGPLRAAPSAGPAKDAGAATGAGMVPLPGSGVAKPVWILTTLGRKPCSAPIW